MAARAWKCATLASSAGVVWLLVHPVQAPAGARDPQVRPSTRDGTRPAGFVPGGGRDRLSELRAARTARTRCAALAQFEAGAGDAVVEEVESLLEAAREPDLRDCAARALAEIGGTRATARLAALAGDAQESVRSIALGALAKSDDPGGRAHVLALARGQDAAARDALLRYDALEAAANASWPEAIGLIVAFLPTAPLPVKPRLCDLLGQTHDATAIPALAQLVQAGPSDVRRQAIAALGTIGGPAAVGVLREALATAPRRELSIIANALAEIDDLTAHAVLIAAAQGTSPEIVNAALEALVESGEPDVDQLMRSHLRADHREVAALACRYFARHRDAAVLPDLMELGRRGLPNVAAQAVEAITQLAGPEAERALRELARTPGPGQSIAIGSLLSNRQGSSESRQVLIQIAREDGGNATASALRALGEDGSPEARATLLAVLREGGHHADAAAQALDRLGDPDAMRALADAATTAKSLGVRVHAISSLLSASDPAAADVLAKLTGDRDPSIRRLALMGLADFGGERATRALRDAAESTDPKMRSVCATVARQVEGPTGLTLLERLSQDPNDEVQRDALVALAGADPERAAARIRESLASGSAEERRRALTAAQQLEPEQAPDIWRAGLHDADPEVQALAIGVLSRGSGREVQDALAELLTARDVPAENRRAAANSLRAIGGAGARRYQDLITRYADPDSQENDSD
jgi:HEAT repeat protein